MQCYVSIISNKTGKIFQLELKWPAWGRIASAWQNWGLNRSVNIGVLISSVLLFNPQGKWAFCILLHSSLSFCYLTLRWLLRKCSELFWRHNQCGREHLNEQETLRFSIYPLGCSLPHPTSAFAPAVQEAPKPSAPLPVVKLGVLSTAPSPRTLS